MEPNVTRFDGRVADYDRYRERYDANVVLPLLRTWCGLTSQWRVADVGAGTGMLADVFLGNGNSVIAIEPNEEMRTMCAQLHPDAPLLEILNGTAENTSLPDASVDAVVVGRALHWFDLHRTMEEFRRVLRPDGWVIVVALGRTEKGREENGEFERVLREASSTHADTHAAYKVYGQLPGFFDGGEFHHKVILGKMPFDWESLRGMTLSLSHSPRVTSPEFPEFERRLREFFDRYSREGVVTLESRYWINAGRFPER
jgi:SAM-dependent methyltransferase